MWVAMLLVNKTIYTINTYLHMQYTPVMNYCVSNMKYWETVLSILSIMQQYYLFIVFLSNTFGCKSRMYSNLNTKNKRK